jgi:hypothetical protein
MMMAKKRRKKRGADIDNHEDLSSRRKHMKAGKWS